MKKFKSLASTPLRKFTAVLSISVLSVSILCSCSNSKTAEIPEVSEQTVNQDADTTEEADKETAHQSNDTKPSTQHTNQSTEPTTQAHVHKYTKSETYYTTETQTIHHDAVTHQETVTTYTDETTTVHHDGCFTCCGCGATFTTGAAAAAHCDNGSDACYGGGYYGSDGWDETVTTQVPHTETVTVTDSPAYDETVEVQVAHKREVCSCGATK